MTAKRPEPMDVLGDSLGFLLSKLGRITSARFAADLAPFGIDPGQYGLLQVVDQGGPRSQQTLGDALGIPANRMVAIVDGLEAMGLLERRRSHTDRRVNVVHLTAGGRRTLAAATEAGMRGHDEMFAGLSVADHAQLLRLLQRVAGQYELSLGGLPERRTPPA